MTLDRMKLSAQTVRENIAILEEVQEPDDAGYYLHLEHEKFVLECIEKQIPKKLTLKHRCYAGSVRRGICPNCLMTENNNANYCRACGQALDWSDLE